jgi:2'-5' RNA ligase
MATSTYHLWVKPAGAAHEALARTIHDLARELDAPVFEPHVTLLANLDRVEEEHFQRASELAMRLYPCEVILTEPSYQNEYFQCVFMRVQPTAAVMRNHALAAELFDRAEEPYMPHVSLVYGWFPESRKREIIGRLPPDVRTSFTVNTLYLLKAGSTAPQDWREIAEFPLAGGRMTRSQPTD